MTIYYQPVRRDAQSEQYVPAGRAQELAPGHYQIGVAYDVPTYVTVEKEGTGIITEVTEDGMPTFPVDAEHPSTVIPEFGVRIFYRER